MRRKLNPYVEILIYLTVFLGLTLLIAYFGTGCYSPKAPPIPTLAELPPPKLPAMVDKILPPPATENQLSVVQPLKWVSVLGILAAVGGTALIFFTPLLPWRAIAGLWGGSIAASLMAHLLEAYGNWFALGLLVAIGFWLIDLYLSRRKIFKQGVKLKLEGHSRDGTALMAVGNRKVNKIRKRFSKAIVADYGDLIG